MSTDLDELVKQAMIASESREVDMFVNQRLRHLQSLQSLDQDQEHDSLNIVLMLPGEIRKLSQQYLSFSAQPLRVDSLNDDELNHELLPARDWLQSILQLQNRALGREHETQMFRSAVKKELKGRQYDWTEKERLYMVLSDGNIASPGERLKAAFVLVLHLNLPQELQDVRKLAVMHADRFRRVTTQATNRGHINEQLIERLLNVKVDHFACAIPMSSLRQSVIDENARCCPICRNDYTDLSIFSIEDLLGDYPVRIKHCGHIIGKACLERWMVTPKIDEARYPFRTCPLCRVQIEGVTPPKVPDALSGHGKTDRYASETLNALVLNYSLDTDERFDGILSCMSEGIACDQLLGEIHRQKSDRGDQVSQADEKFLQDKIEQLDVEKRAWGFRGEGTWKKVRDEWMKSGIIRNE